MFDLLISDFNQYIATQYACKINAVTSSATDALLQKSIRIYWGYTKSVIAIQNLSEQDVNKIIEETKATDVLIINRDINPRSAQLRDAEEMEIADFIYSAMRNDLIWFTVKGPFAYKESYEINNILANNNAESLNKFEIEMKKVLGIGGAKPCICNFDPDLMSSIKRMVMMVMERD